MVNDEGDDVIERVARALCDDALQRWRPPIALHAEPWREFIPAARAAIEALRLPSAAMIEAGQATECSHGDQNCGAEYSFIAMIDAALSGDQ